jgi:septum formation protein
MTKVILASGSAIRAQVLAAAGVPFEIVKPDVDEDAVKRDAAQSGMALRDIAQRLADAKASSVRRPGSVVIGSDQIMAFEGRGFDKARSVREARERLALLQGKPHTLINAVSIARDGVIAFRHLDEPQLHMRTMSDDEISAYLADAGEGILASVGAYQVEARGARLFERIDGDYFAVLGLSLLPVLGYLRREGLLEY